MHERIKRAIRKVVPGRMLELIINRFFRVRWEGDYATWADAMSRSRGYGEAAILNRVAHATRLARDGVVAFERDGRAFQDPEPNERLLTVLRAAARGTGLAVLDFGGALGSAYWQNRSWLPSLGPVDWCVVDQPHFVAVGLREFANEELHFAATIEEAVGRRRYDVLLLAGVLGYLAEPHALLRRLAGVGIPHVYIERTGFLLGAGPDRLTVQHVPRNLYHASYPCWFFEFQGVVSHFEPAYRSAGVWSEGFAILPGVEYRAIHLQCIEP